MTYCHWTKSLHSLNNPRRRSRTVDRLKALLPTELERAAPPATPASSPAHQFAIVISCGGAKRDCLSPARELYTGSYFRALLAWAESVPNAPQIFILSAKYGLLQLDDMIPPYDVKMPPADARNRRQAVSLDCLRDQLSGPRLRIYFAGGADYADTLTAAGAFVQRVMPAGLGMGEQLAWLKAHAGAELDTWAGA